MRRSLRVSLIVMICGGLISLGYFLIVAGPRADMEARLRLVRSVPVSEDADPVESGTDGSWFCVSPSCIETWAFSVWSYSDAKSACEDANRLGETWADSGTVTYWDPCGWSGSVEGRAVTVSVDTQDMPPHVYVNA